jgi:hypothetical protein
VPSRNPRYPINADRIVGDGGNLTVYERPDKSRYALDKRGNGREYDPAAPTFGRERFDSRKLSTGRWDGSRSAPQTVARPPAGIGQGRSARRG